MLSSEVEQSLKSYVHFSDLGVGIALSHRHVGFFMVKQIHPASFSERTTRQHLKRPLSYTEHCAACSNQTQTARVYPNADSSLRKHEDLTQCCFNVGPAPLAVGQYWNSIGSNPRVFWAPHKPVSLHPPLPSIIFSPADQGTFSKTAGQSQAYYNTWNWEWGTYDVIHLHILTCEIAVSRASSVPLSMHAPFCQV